mmetsp:Transcript_25940/g.76739  ORF Transcript_25940/g.76739 Transcript_25940/m.76739 type:complete len:362 (-) Transcript_25940:877-1962(-)
MYDAASSLTRADGGEAPLPESSPASADGPRPAREQIVPSASTVATGGNRSIPTSAIASRWTCGGSRSKTDSLFAGGSPSPPSAAVPPFFFFFFFLPGFLGAANSPPRDARRDRTRSPRTASPPPSSLPSPSPSSVASVSSLTNATSSKISIISPSTSAGRPTPWVRATPSSAPRTAAVSEGKSASHDRRYDGRARAMDATRDHAEHEKKEDGFTLSSDPASMEESSHRPPPHPEGQCCPRSAANRRAALLPAGDRLASVLGSAAHSAAPSPTASGAEEKNASPNAPRSSARRESSARRYRPPPPPPPPPPEGGRRRSRATAERSIADDEAEAAAASSESSPPSPPPSAAEEEPDGSRRGRT